ncbi:unnamed protein product, partial [Closterium sp. Naga37s-1]
AAISACAPPWRRCPPPPTSSPACLAAPALPRPWRAPTPRPRMRPPRAAAGGRAVARAGSGTSAASTLRSTRRRVPMALTCGVRRICAAPTAPSCRTSACASACTPSPPTPPPRLTPFPRASCPSTAPHALPPRLMPFPRASFPFPAPHALPPRLMPFPRASCPSTAPHALPPRLMPFPRASCPSPAPHALPPRLMPFPRASCPSTAPHALPPRLMPFHRASCPSPAPHAVPPRLMPFPRPSCHSPAPQPPQITIATAIVFCHRFFMRQSHAKNDRYAIATVCMFLAGKVEETPRALREVVQKSLDAQARKDPAAAAKLPHKEEQQREVVLVGEGLVLATLGFDLNVAHAYKPLVAAVKRFKVAQQALAQVAWNFINDGLRTSLCLQVRAEQFAAGAISLAAKFLRVKLPGDSDSPWWADFNVTPKLLHDVSVQLLELYEQVRLAPNPSHVASTAIAPSAAAAARGTSRGAASSLSSQPPLPSATTTSSSAPSQGRASAGGFSDSRGAAAAGGAVGAQGARRHSDGERERDVERGGQRESDRRREREAVKGRDGRAGGSVGGEGGCHAFILSIDIIR